MNNIPKKLKKVIISESRQKVCVMYGQEGHLCDGRITFDHAIIFGGKQLQEDWAILPLCAKGHGVDEFQGHANVAKEKRTWIALNRAPGNRLMEISKAMDYVAYRERLNKKYGPYSQRYPTVAEMVQPKSGEPKANWYLISYKDRSMIEKLRQFRKRALGVNVLPREVIADAIESSYLEVKDQLIEQDETLYKELGFDK